MYPVKTYKNIIAHISLEKNPKSVVIVVYKHCRQKIIVKKYSSTHFSASLINKL